MKRSSRDERTGQRGSGDGGRHARVSPTPGRGSKIAYTPCPRSEPPQDLALAVPPPPRNCLAIPMSSLQTANGPGTKGESRSLGQTIGAICLTLQATKVGCISIQPLFRFLCYETLKSCTTHEVFVTPAKCFWLQFKEMCICIFTNLI